MKLSEFKVFLVLLIVMTNTAFAFIPNYHDQSELFLSSPGAFKTGYEGYYNPALLQYLDSPEFDYVWTASTHSDRSGLFFGVPGLGLGVIKNKDASGHINDYRISNAFGDRDFSLGFGYGWSDGDTNTFNRKKLFTIGSLWRSSEFSFGIVGNFETNGKEQEGIYDIAYRPYGNEFIALFADYAVKNNEKPSKRRKSLGAVIEPFSGIRFATRYFNKDHISFGLDFSFGGTGISSQRHVIGKKDTSYYNLRLGGYDRNIFRTYMKKETNYLILDLSGYLNYRHNSLFDKSNTILAVLDIIDAARKDKQIGGIAINATDMKVTNPSILWELRDKLKEFRAAEKHVVVFINEASMDMYYFASIADKVIIHPLGAVSMSGFSIGKTYYRESLEKIGIGFQEFGYFKYKSALEGFSRKNMSEGDREQLKKFVEDEYGVYQSDICMSRKITGEQFDNLIDNETFLSLPAENSQQLKLVDGIGTWASVNEVIKEYEGVAKQVVGISSLEKYKLPQDDKWGEAPQIAVVYALGSVAMDSGVNAHAMARLFEALMSNPSIKAVVLRIDSPGGSAIASDTIAEAITRCRAKKPVIISQGLVAASGGYWLSINGDAIVSHKNTMTGSIGVIGGYVYNSGLKENLGISTDLVKKGKHSDIYSGFSVPIPFLGLYIPNRKLDDEELKHARREIFNIYRFFVNKVAVGRNKKPEDIETVAQGRIWSGKEALRVGLVDALGGMDVALRIAKEKAGIPEEAEVTLLEFPEPPFFSFDRLFGVRANLTKNSLLDYLNIYVDNNGKPLTILPIDLWDIRYLESTHDSE